MSASGNRLHRLTALLGVVAIVAVACGSRVEPLAIDAISGQPLSGAQNSGQTTAGTQAQAGTQGTAGRQVGGGGPGLVPGCKKGPSRPNEGITDSTIKVGLIYSRTGPFPGQFDAAVEAVDAHVKNVNAQGGICERTIELFVKDDTGSGAVNLQVANELAVEEKVFAFVGSVSAPDDTGIAKVSGQRKIPDIGFPLTWERTENKYTYGVPGQIQRKLIGEGASGSKYLNQLKGVKQIAIYWVKESEVSILSAWGFEAAMKKATNNQIEICHEQPTGVLDNNFTNYVVSMIGNCDPDIPTGVYSTMENNSNIKLADAMEQQGFEPAVFAPTFSSYLRSFARKDNGQPRSSTAGAFIAMPQIPFERCGQDSRGRPVPPCSHEELDDYISTLRRFKPTYRAPGSFGAPGWGMASLFVEAVKGCGSGLSRSCLFKQLDSMGPFSANSFLSPTRPRDHVIYGADLVVEVRNGNFVELRPNDASGPKEAPAFWDQSTLFNWQRYVCDNQGEFPNADGKIDHPAFTERC